METVFLALTWGSGLLFIVAWLILIVTNDWLWSGKIFNRSKKIDSKFEEHWKKIEKSFDRQFIFLSLENKFSRAVNLLWMNKVILMNLSMAIDKNFFKDNKSSEFLELLKESIDKISLHETNIHECINWAAIASAEEIVSDKEKIKFFEGVLKENRSILMNLYDQFALINIDLFASNNPENNLNNDPEDISSNIMPLFHMALVRFIDEQGQVSFQDISKKFPSIPTKQLRTVLTALTFSSPDAVLIKTKIKSKNYYKVAATKE